MLDLSAKPTAPRGRSLKLYLVDGSPTGVITAELGISSVRAVMASRTALPDLIHREEAKRTGIYLLIGPDPDLPDHQLVYVGEGDQVGTRLTAHDGDEAKEFFTRAVLIVSKDENLTKAHARYLESRVIAAVRSAARAKLVNGTNPALKGLPEPEIADMERVLDEIEVLLPVLGFDILRVAGKAAGAASAAPLMATAGKPSVGVDGPIFTFTESGTNANAREANGEFVVLAGSLAKQVEVASCPDALKKRRREMVTDGTLENSSDGKFLRFTRDTPFDSSSAAARVIYGGNASGLRYWKHTLTGETYGNWRQSEIAAGDAP